MFLVKLHLPSCWSVQLLQHLLAAETVEVLLFPSRTDGK